MWQIKHLNDIAKYCEKAQCIKTQSQKEAKRFNTAGNDTQISKAMRYAQLVRK